MVVGIASDKGYLSSEEDFIFNYLPDHTSFRTGGREKITIRHMLTMSERFAVERMGCICFRVKS